MKWCLIPIITLFSAVACARGPIGTTPAPCTTSDRCNVTSSSDPVYEVKAHGATADGSTDDTTAVQAAADAVGAGGGGVLYFPPGTYVLDGVTLSSNTTVLGDGAETTTLKLKDKATGHVFSARRKDHITICGVTLDMNAAGQGDPGVTFAHCGLHATWVSFLHVSDCRFENVFEASLYLSGCAYVSVEDCSFAGDTVGNPTEWAVMDIRAVAGKHQCFARNYHWHTQPADYNYGVTGLFVSDANDVAITNNTIVNCGRLQNLSGHQTAAIDLYSGNQNVIVRDNTVLDYLVWGIRIRGRNILVGGNYFSSTSPSSHDAAVEVGQGNGVPAYDIVISENVIETLTTDGYGVQLELGAPVPEPCNVSIIGNRISGYRNIYAVAADGLTIIDNHLIPYNQAITFVEANNLDINDVTIRGNYVDASNLTSTAAMNVDMTDHGVVADNVILDAYQGIMLRIATGGRCYNNIVDASNSHYLIYNTSPRLFFHNNLAIGTDAKIWQQGSNVTYFATLDEDNGG